jgi:hypothetical protein
MMTEFLTIREVSVILKISTQTIYNNGPAQYGGVKIGGFWRFPSVKIGIAPESIKREISSGYTRRFGKKKGKRVNSKG